MQDVTAVMPNLRLVEIGYNNLSRLSVLDNPPANESTIQTINLDSNECHDWVHICGSVGPYNSLVNSFQLGHEFRSISSLQRLILASNWIETIPLPEDHQLPLQGLKHISLSFNRLQAWCDFDALSRWCPALETLTVSGNPIDGEHVRHHFNRLFLKKLLHRSRACTILTPIHNLQDPYPRGSECGNCVDIFDAKSNPS
jgi:Leucine-rich repeat (LRR) protein